MARTYKMRAMWSTATGAATAAVLLVAVGCGKHEEKAAAAPGRERPAVEVTLADISLGVLPKIVEVTGTLYGDEEGTVSAKVPGRIKTYQADVGDRVAPGEPLAQIDPTDYQLVIDERQRALSESLAKLGLKEVPARDFDVSGVATVQRAVHVAENAKAKRERGRQLIERKPPAISEQDYQDLVTAYQVAESNQHVAVLEAQSQLAQVFVRLSELESARQRLADTTVPAPQRSKVHEQASKSDDMKPYAMVERRATAGMYVREGDVLYRFVVDDPIRYRAAVPERFVQQVKVGQNVVVQVDDGGPAVNGSITRINPAIDAQTRSFQIEVTIENADRRLRPGAFARGMVQVGEESDVVFVPRKAVVTFAGLDRVFSVKDGKAVEHKITLVSREGEMLPIREKVDAQAVVIGGASKLANEVPVTIGAGKGGDGDGGKRKGT